MRNNNFLFILLVLCFLVIGFYVTNYFSVTRDILINNHLEILESQKINLKNDSINNVIFDNQKIIINNQHEIIDLLKNKKK